MSAAILITTAVLLGMRHALDPDHLVAVSTLVAEERRLWPAARLGLVWGLGHLVPLAAVGLPALLLRLQLPAAMEDVVDLGVGLLLVGLGTRTLWRWRRDGVHFHRHQHGTYAHAHFHVHGHRRRTITLRPRRSAPASAPLAAGTHGPHGHAHPLDDRRRRWITFGIGMVHGLAGSGAAAILALTSAPTVASGAGYLLAFGLGTCAGMFAMTLCVAAPALAALSRAGAVHGLVRATAGLASIALGVILWLEIVPELLA